MTFIFNYGDFQPQEERCFMIRGKIRDINKQDVINFAKDNGIKKAETIISEVAQTVKSFSAIANKYNVKDKWTKLIESCLSTKLSEWDYVDTETWKTRLL